MSRYSCANESKVLAALSSGVWEIGLCQHAKDCPLCSDLLAVAECLRQEAGRAMLEPVLPSAEFLWWKSKLLAREMALQQATRPIAFVTNLAYLVCGAAVLWFLFMSAQAHLWLLTTLRDETHRQALWTGASGALALVSLGGALLSAILASVYMAWIER